MARMIPARIDDSVLSSAERRVFRLLQTDPGTSDWTALHSLVFRAELRVPSAKSISSFSFLAEELFAWKSRAVAYLVKMGLGRPPIVEGIWRP